MSYAAEDEFFTWESEYAKGLHPVDLYASLRKSGRGASNAGPRMTYVVLLRSINHESGDRYVWPAQDTVAALTGQNANAVCAQMKVLVEGGLLTQARKADVPARAKGEPASNVYWVVDVQGEAAALAEYRSAAIAQALRASGVDVHDQAYDAAIPEHAAAVDTVIDKARQRFLVDHPGHYPTAGRVLAYLQGQEASVRPVATLSMNRARRARVLAAAAEKVAESHNVPAEAAASLVRDAVGAMAEQGLPVTARALVAAQYDGTLAEYLPGTVGPVAEAEPVNVDPAWAVAYERAQHSGVPHPVVVRLGSGEWVGVDRGSAIRFHGLGGAGVAAAEAVVRVQQARRDEAA